MMKRIQYILLLVSICCLHACTKLEVSPLNIIEDDDVFTSTGGIRSYFARMYSELPIEDFRYSPARGLNHFWIISPFSAVTGEALSRDQRGAMSESVLYWDDAYRLIREANYFLETLPQHANNFEASEVTSWIGETYFIRAFVYY